MTEQNIVNLILGHLLKAIQFRMDSVIKDASPDFWNYSVRAGTRVSHEIMSHVADLLSFAIKQVDEDPFSFEVLTDDWASQVSRYRAALLTLGIALEKKQLSEELTCRLSQGPIADALTHIGQLAMLRGLAGHVVPAQVYFTKNLPEVVPE